MARAKKRADGRYCTQIYLGRDENGRRQYKSVYAKSPAELKEKETAVRLQLGRGLDVLSQRDSFSTWADDWLRLKEKEEITCRQMDNYRRAVKLWKEELQGYEIGQVRAPTTAFPSALSTCTVRQSGRFSAGRWDASFRRTRRNRYTSRR